MNMDGNRRARRTLWLSLIGGALFTYLFLERLPGLSVPLFVLFTLLSLFLLNTNLSATLSKQNLWLLFPILMAAAAFAYYENPLLLLLNLGLLILFSLLWAHFMMGGNPARQSLWSYLFIPPQVISGQIEKPMPMVQDHVDLDAWQSNVRLYIIPTVRGVIFAVPLLALFALLMLSADVVFAQLLRDILAIEIDIALGRWLRNSFITLIVAWLTAGWLIYAAKPYADREIHLPERLLRKVCRQFRLGPIETNTILTLISGLFALFVLVQFAYLFGGLNNLSLNGLSYAEYARRGFFELTTVAILTLGIILVLRKITRFIDQKGLRIFRLLSSIIVGFTLVVLVSAFKRMFLYEQAFGFTELRLYVHVSIIWLAILLVWFVFTLWSNEQGFAIGALIAAVGFVGTLNLIQPERFIVRQNIARYETTGDLDVAYLSTLSADATPTIIQFLKQQEIISDQPCQNARPISPRNRSKICSNPPDLSFLQNQLMRDYRSLETKQHWRDWPEAHIGRIQAFKALQTYFPRLNRIPIKMCKL